MRCTDPVIIDHGVDVALCFNAFLELFTARVSLDRKC